jgi:predicted dehydrogenase
MKPTVFAVVGCGLIGCKRIAALPPGSTLKYVFDIAPANAQRAALLVDYPVTIASTLESILADKSVDVILIATSHHELVPVALQAVQSGHHVLIEKPGGMCLNDIKRLRSAAGLAGVVVHVGYNHRFHPSLIEAKAIIDSNRFGGLLWMRGRYGHGGRLGYEKEWRANRSISGGGELVDQGSHLIDICSYLSGDIELVFSETQSSFWDTDVEDNAFFALRPRTGGFAWMHASWTEWKNIFSFEITLEKAKIDISGLGGSYGIETLTLYEMQPEMGPPPSSTLTWDESDASWTLELEDLNAHINDPGHIPTGTSLDGALVVWEIIEKAYRA